MWIDDRTLSAEGGKGIKCNQKFSQKIGREGDPESDAGMQENFAELPVQKLQAQRE